MRQISKEEFFATIGQMDVMPRTDISTYKLPSSQWVTYWETRDRKLVGKSIGSGTKSAQYFTVENG